jgi:hypothetical protein
VGCTLNETFAKTSSIGFQKQSQKYSMPKYSMTRGARTRTHIMKAHMEFTQPSVRIDHPRF